MVVAAIAAIGLWSGCGAEPVEVADDEEGGSGSGLGKPTGGEGGTGGEAMPSPCGQDCSQIATPPCYVGECNTGQHPGPVNSCVVVPGPAGEPCDDGQFCTVDDVCDEAGVCTGGPPNDCGMAVGDCETVTCDEASKACSVATIPAGEPCDPNDLCIIGATCNAAGQCEGTLNDCFFSPVPSQCHVAVCNPENGMCEPQPGNFGKACTDPNDLCTVDRKCDNAGTCGGGSPKCGYLSVGCTNGICDPVTGDCSTQQVAPGGACLQATDDCNQGICQSNNTCVATAINEGGSCDDGLSCTSNTTCASGSCQGGVSNITTFLLEDFSDNSAGWTLDTTWAIGPAVAYNPGSCGNGDPGTDTTSNTSDNGIAGAVIGGTVGTALTNGYRYLTSPVLNTASAPTVWLQYNRYLNSDYTRYMNNRVEVFDGTTWQLVWESGPSPAVQDAAWTTQTHDISAYKNTQMRVRFGYNINSSGVYSGCGGWNLDDVLIGTGICQ